jgi:hypothetical protein
MPSATKQQKRAKRAKTKAKQMRMQRNNKPDLTPIVPDYFMPDTMALDELEDDAQREAYRPLQSP